MCFYIIITHTKNCSEQGCLPCFKSASKSCFPWILFTLITSHHYWKPNDTKIHQHVNKKSRILPTTVQCTEIKCYILHNHHSINNYHQRKYSAPVITAVVGAQYSIGTLSLCSSLLCVDSADRLTYSKIPTIKFRSRNITVGDLERYLSVQGFDIYVYTSIRSVLPSIYQLEPKIKMSRISYFYLHITVPPFLRFYQQNIRKLV